MKIDALYIYPVKSCSGIRVGSAVLQEHGLMWDRRWMIVDNQGQFLSQRRLPQMALVAAHVIERDHGQTDLILKWRDGQETVALEPTEPKLTRVKVWNDWVDAWSHTDATNATLSEWLGTPCHLVRLPEPRSRMRTIQELKNPFAVSFADSSPLLMTTQETLSALELHHGRSLDMTRFRPNIVVSGAQAFEEDTWQRVWTDKVHFDGAYPCKRCVMIEIDQQTALRNEALLPSLRELRETKSVLGGLVFGRHLVPTRVGSLYEGDQIYAHGA
jgi:uncharacterized protein YcbX